MECGVIGIAHTLGKKWSISLLSDIRSKKFEGFYKFTKKTKVTPKILSKQLKELEKAKLIEKKNSLEKYVVTQKGEELCKILDSLKEWGIKWEKVPSDCLEKSCSECKLFF